MWILIGEITWHLWQGRNRWWRISSFKSEDVVLAVIIKDCKICFEVKAKLPDIGLAESLKPMLLDNGLLIYNSVLLSFCLSFSFLSFLATPRCYSLMYSSAWPLRGLFYFM